MTLDWSRPPEFVCLQKKVCGRICVANIPISTRISAKFINPVITPNAAAKILVYFLEPKTIFASFKMFKDCIF